MEDLEPSGASASSSLPAGSTPTLHGSHSPRPAWRGAAATGGGQVHTMLKTHASHEPVDLDALTSQTSVRQVMAALAGAEPAPQAARVETTAATPAAATPSAASSPAALLSSPESATFVEAPNGTRAVRTGRLEALIELATSPAFPGTR
jgi:hypothetical protein